MGWPWPRGSRYSSLPRHWWGNRFVDLIAAVVADALEAADAMDAEGSRFGGRG